MGKTGARLPYVDQLSFLVVHPQNNGTKMLAGPLWFGVTTDHAIDGIGDFDLQPFACALLFITAVALLGQNPFEPLLFGCRKQSLTLIEMLRQTQRAFRHSQSCQCLFALFQWQAAKIVSVEVNKIKSVIEDLYL